MAQLAGRVDSSPSMNPPASDGVRIVEGNLVAPPGVRFALVASRFNHFIVDHLVEGAKDALFRHGVEHKNVVVVRVPGAWESPFAAQRIALGSGGKRPDGIIGLGAVIRGSTPHFDYVAGQVTRGLAQVSMEQRIAVAFGVLTTDTIEQAIERAGTKAGNKGWDAALSALEMVNLSRALEQEGV